MYKNILVVVDYQYDFVSPEGALYVPEAETVVSNIQKEIDDPKYDAIVYTMDTHIKEDYEKSEEAKIFPLHCEFNTKGWDFFGIKPRNREIKRVVEEGVFDKPKNFSVNDEFIFVKDVFSVWEGNSQYEKWVKENSSPETIFTVVGVAENYCVYMNAMGYSNTNRKNINIVKDAVKGIKDESYEKNIQIMKNRDVKYI